MRMSVRFQRERSVQGRSCSIESDVNTKTAVDKMHSDRNKSGLERVD